MTKSKLLEMNNVGIVVENLYNATSFFKEIRLKLEGRAMIEGEWAGRVTGLGNQSSEVAMMVTPDGHSRLKISKFLTPTTIADHRKGPVNSLGYLRLGDEGKVSSDPAHPSLPKSNVKIEYCIQSVPAGT